MAALIPSARLVYLVRHPVERAVSHWRQELRAEARATMRFETPPGYQLQIDFGEIRASVASEG